MRERNFEKGNISVAAKKLLNYVGNLKIPAAVALVFAALGAVLTIIGPDYLSQMTNEISAGLYGDVDMEAIGKLGAFLLTIYIASSVFMFIQHYIMATVTLRLSKKLRGDISRKINNVPLKFFGTVSTGDILSRLTNDVVNLQQALSNALPSIISSVAQFIGCLIMMFVTEWHLALSAISVTALGFLVMIVVISHSQKYFVARQRSLGAVNGYVEEMYSGHDVVRISRADEKIKNAFANLNRELYDANWRSQFLAGIMQPLMGVVGNVGYVVVCVVGSMLIMNGEGNFGDIVAFIMYVRLFTSPLSNIAQGMTNMQTAAAAGERIFSFLEEEEMEDDTDKLGTPETVRGEVEFRNVRFSYPSNPDKIIIKGFSAHVQPGQKVAIVGPTGAGKTTMVNLLMKFFDINSGEILIDGIPISQMKRSAVHDMFSMVLQDTWTFEGTVRENLTYNKEGVSEETLERACRACGIYSFIRSLPNGFDTVLNENTTISAGQKQLLTIARAMVQNSPMLILDEATSSVDTRTELITQRAMDKLTENRTSFVIAHRLSTIRNADLILVLKDGDIIEQGTHETLLEKGGFYADLYRSQFEKVS